MAFLTTIREGQHRRQSLGAFPCPSEEFGGRRGIQSWTDQNVHEVGSVRRIHIPTAASPLEGPSWIPTVTPFSVLSSVCPCMQRKNEERAFLQRDRRYYGNACGNRDVGFIACAGSASSSSDRTYELRYGVKFAANGSCEHMKARAWIIVDY